MSGVPLEIIAEIAGLGGTLTSRLLTVYRSSARKRGLSFNLDRDLFADLIRGACFYCGGALSNRFAIRDEQTVFPMCYQGIDRVDNARGYEPDNVVSCCRACNVAKAGQSQAEFLRRAREIAGHPL